MEYQNSRENIRTQAEPLHLRTVHENDTLLIATRYKNERFICELEKMRTGSLLEDWALVTRDEEGGVIWACQGELALHKNGFRHPGVVLRENIEIGFYSQQLVKHDQPTTLKSLGKIEEIRHIIAKGGIEEHRQSSNSRIN